MKDPNYAPMYAAMYPDLAKITRDHGYALAVHGSLARDMDLICVPWVESPSEPADVVKAITDRFYVRVIGAPDTVFHGRERWVLSIGFGECFIDLSFMPRVESSVEVEEKEVDVSTTCPRCKSPWDDHEFGVPWPTCP